MFKKILLVWTIALLVILISPYYYQKHYNVYTYIQDATCFIRTQEGNAGSGVFKRANGRTYVITACHVIDGTKFDDVTVVRHEYQEMKKYGELRLLAKIINKSPKTDLALLELYGRKPVGKSITISSNRQVEIGTKLILVGSPFGEFGYNSIGTGIMSQYDRHFDNKSVDESTILNFPGNSGGGLFVEDGQLVGISFARTRTGSCLFTPLRTIYKWIEDENLQFLLGD